MNSKVTIENLEANVNDILNIYKRFTPTIYGLITEDFHKISSNQPRTSLVSNKSQKRKQHITSVVKKIQILTNVIVMENNKNLSKECMKELEKPYEILLLNFSKFNS